MPLSPPCPSAWHPFISLQQITCSSHLHVPLAQSYPHVPVAELGLIQGKAQPPVTEHRARTPRGRSIFAATGTSKGRLWTRCAAGNSRECQLSEHHLPIPPTTLALLQAPGSKIKSLDTEQGHKGTGAEGTRCIEVRVIGCPASHDFLIVHQGITGMAQGTARHQNLWVRRHPRKSASFGSNAPKPMPFPAPSISKLQPGLLPPPPPPSPVFPGR